MSWKALTQMARRLQFVKLALKAQQSMSQLCRVFRISRKNGYKWKQRFEPPERADVAARRALLRRRDERNKVLPMSLPAAPSIPLPVEGRGRSDLLLGSAISSSEEPVFIQENVLVSRPGRC